MLLIGLRASLLVRMVQFMSLDIPIAVALMGRVLTVVMMPSLHDTTLMAQSRGLNSWEAEMIKRLRASLLVWMAQFMWRVIPLAALMIRRITVVLMHS